MLIKGSFSAYRLYSQNVALLCLGGHCSYTSLYMEEKTLVQICAGVLMSWTHVESCESRSISDEGLVAEGIR